MSKLKTPQEMDRIREAEARIQEKLRRDFVPEKNESKPLAYFEISRYVRGSFRGLFVVTQLITEDGHGEPIKKPIRKVVADGVDLFVAMTSLETALRRRVFR